MSGKVKASMRQTDHVIFTSRPVPGRFKSGTAVRCLGPLWAWSAGRMLGMRCVGIVFLLLLSLAPGQASSVQQYGARLWQTDDGLPQNNVRAVVQSRDGYLWLATPGSLSRFDGVRFASLQEKTIFELSAPKTDFSFFTLATGGDGSLWVGSGHGLFRLSEGRAHACTEADGPGDRSVRVILPTRDGAVWVGTTDGLFRFMEGKWTGFSTTDGLSQEAIRTLCEEREGNVWIAGDVALHRFRDGTLTRLDIPRSIAYGAVRAICEDATGALWIGLNSGLLRWKDGVFRRFTVKEGLLHEVVSVIYEDRQGTLWVGTYGGLNRVQNGEVVAGVNAGEVPQDVINFITEDREGSIWVGCKDGLRQLHPRRFNSYTTRDGLANNNVVSIREDRMHDRLWIGSWSGGLSFLERGQITTVRARPGGPPPFMLGLHQDEEGFLWLGVDFEAGIFRWKDGELTRFPHVTGTIRIIFEDRSGNLWLGSSSGLGLFRDGQLAAHPLVEKLAGHTVRVIFEDNEGALWIGTDRGLYGWSEGKLSTFTTTNGLPHRNVVAIHQDRDGTLWLGTVGGGLCRVNARDVRRGDDRQAVSNDKHKENPPGAGDWLLEVSRFTARDGFFSDDVFEILEDDNGFLWMSCQTGVFRVSKKNLNDFVEGKTSRITNAVFGKRDGLASLECNSVAKPGAWKSRDGRLWFATSQGVSVVDPSSRFDSYSEPPPVVVEQVIADKQIVSQEAGVRWPSVSTQSRVADLTIQPGRGELEIHYTALSFIDSEKIRFKYRLKGNDTDWVDAGSRRLATYSNLRPGQYRFEVVASDPHGNWSSPGAGLTLRLQPHFWQTWWFAGGCLVFCLGTVAFGVRYVSVRRLQTTLLRLEQQHAVERERARIAQDMHDGLGARLTEILLVTEFARNSKAASEEVKRHAQQIARSAREVIDNLDAIVWAVNPENDTLDMFVTYVCEYAEMFVGMSNIRCRLNVPEKMPSSPLSSETRHNLFMAIKEGLNNAVKYSGASEIRLAFDVSDSALTLDLEDNGQGFSVQDISRSSNGLRNMEKRLEKIGGCCEISSTPGSGTRLRFRIVLP